MNRKRFRLLKAGIVLICLIIVSSVLVNANLSTDASSVNLPPMSQKPSPGNAVSRGRNIPSKDVLKSAGYQKHVPDGFTESLENEYAKLLFSENTGAIALIDKRTGQVWLSNPDLSKETVIAGDAKTVLNAQVIFKYYDENNRYVIWDSYGYAAKNGAISSRLENGRLIVSYTLGKSEVTIEDVPQQIGEERFLKFISALSEAEQKKMMTTYYVKQTIRGVSEKTAASLIEKYPNIINNDIYTIRDANNPALLAKAKENWDACGYTVEDLRYDNEENGVISEVKQSVRYVFDIVYELDGAGLKVSLDLGDMDISGPHPNEIHLLPYFGCGASDEDGYILVPDGSGALIGFNNGKINAPQFSMKVYGQDTALEPDRLTQADEKLSMPVWGIKKGKAAILAVIEEGAAIARIEAAVSGKANSWNTVSALFEPVLAERIERSYSSVMLARQNKAYAGMLSIHYMLLSEGEEDYIGMAQAYRSLLLKTGGLPDGDGIEGYALQAEILGGVKIPNKNAVISIDKITAMTTFSQTREICEDLRLKGVSDIDVKFDGWLSGGLAQNSAHTSNILNACGGRKGLSELAEYCENAGIRLFLSTGFTHVSSPGGLLSGYRNAITLGQEYAYKYSYNYLSRYKISGDDKLYQISPAHWVSAAEAFLKTGKGKGYGLAISDLGSALYGDYYRPRVIERNEAMLAALKALSALSGKYSLLLENPNAYALSVATGLDGIPATYSGYYICDEYVPFYQAVIRGSLNYTCPPLNYAADFQTALLNAVECGSQLSFLFSYTRNDILKDSGYAHLDRGWYGDWTQYAAEAYVAAKTVLDPVAGQRIVSHERLMDGVYVTGYENRALIYVNYTSEQVTVNGVEIPAFGFTLDRGEG